MSEPDAAALVAELETAAKTFDTTSATSICDRLIAGMYRQPAPIDVKLAKQALGLLRSMRAFADMRRLGDACLATGQDGAQIVRQYAQALIESGALVAAEKVLLDLASREPLGSAEGDEARGLLGRTYKQMYLDAGNPRASGAKEALQKSVAAYLEVYENDPSKTWHGQNAAEMLLRAERDGLAIEGPDPRVIARTILDRITKAHEAGEADIWDLGTARQVAMVLGEGDVAREWLKRRMEAEPDAFVLASGIRQLEEVWGITEDDLAWGDMLAVMKSHMMEAGGGQSIQVDHLPPEPEAFEQRSGGLEKTFGSAGAVTVKWWTLAQERLRAIARIEDHVGTAIGTAFLVKASDLNPEWGDDAVAVTNAHVVSHPPAMRGTIEPDDAVANFTMLEGLDPIEVTELLFQSGPLDLDVAVLRLASVPEGVTPVPLAKALPRADGEQRLYVMGHPLGGELKISIDDNVLIDHDDVKVHYRAPTEPGSSGSPVFNRNWQLIALHHAGNDRMERLHGEKGTYQANEGIAFKAITEACARPPGVG